jgi:hypothetical protein
MSIISQGFLNNRIASIGYTYILRGPGKGIGPYSNLDGLEIFLDATNSDSYSGSGNTWYDLSGKGRHATLNNGTAFVGSGNTAYFSFDGTDDSASTGGTSFPFYAFEIIFKNHRRTVPNVVMNPYYSIFGMSLDGFDSPSLNIGEWTGSDTDETLSIWWKWPTNGNVNTYIRDNVDAVFNHLIVNWNGSQYDFYLNGTKRTIYAGGSGGHTPFMDAVYNISLGKVIAFNYFFKGNISLFKAWNKPLSTTEITSQYNTKKSYLNFTPRLDRTSLVCHYDFSNSLSYSGSGATVYDLSGYGNNGTLGGTYTYNSSGDKYIALTSGYINIGNPSTMLVTTGDFTVELWAWVNSSNGLYSKIFAKGSWMTGTSFIMGYTPTVGGAWMELYINASRIDGPPFNPTATFNTWRHIVWRRQNGYWDIYVSGTSSVPIFYNASNISNSYNWIIGGNSALNELNNCRIGLFKLYQRALSNAEIMQSYSEFQNRFYPQLVKSGLTFLVDASNPESYPGRGTVWYDISGKGYNINLVNGPTYSGEYGGAMVFDGTNDYGITRSLAQLEMGNRSCTIAAWFKTTDTTGAIATKRGTGTGYELYIYGSGKLYADGYSTATGVFSVSAINNNTVKYGVVVFDYPNSTIRLYINGVADNTASLSSGGNDTSAYFNIARSQQYTDYFAGTIYSVQVYNKALSATEILQNFNAGKGRFSL